MALIPAGRRLRRLARNCAAASLDGMKTITWNLKLFAALLEAAVRSEEVTND